MAQCPDCLAEVRVHLRSCPGCGSDLQRRVLTDDERSQARLCHLLGAPGMMIFLLPFPLLGALALLPLNLIAPLIYRWLRPQSRTVQRHTAEALNFQAPWTAAMAALWLILLFASPSNEEPLLSGARFLPAPYQADRLVDWTTAPLPLDDGQPAQGSEEEEESSHWVLAAIAFSLLGTAWLFGIGLAAYLTYGLGNGGSGRYPLRLPLFKSD